MSRLSAWIAAVAWIAATLWGCGAPDYWSAFDEGAERNIRIERARDSEDPIPEPFEPEFEVDAALPIRADGDPIELSIEQAAIFALRNNRDLEVQQLNPVITGTFEAIQRGVFDPEVFADLSFARERVSETARATGERFDVVGEDTSALGGIRQTLPTGTDVELTVEEGRTFSDRAPEQQEARIGLTITQSLLEGLGPAVNLASVRQAELDSEASVYQLRGFTEALLADVEIAYWNYELAREEIAIFEQSLEIARQQRDQIEQRIEVGVLPETEAAAARAEVALREQALIDARSALRANRLRLLRLINPSREGRLDIEIDTVSEPRVEAEPIVDVEERLRLADRRRPDLNESRLRLEQGRLETIVTRNGLLPRLDVFISLGKSGFATTLADSFANLDSDSYDFSAGVSVSQALGNQAARARDLAARVTREQASRALSNLRQIVRFEVRTAINEVERARQQITASAATRRLQEQTVEAERQRFDVGASTALLVAQAQRDLLAARIAEVEAVVNYRIALVELYLAEGSLLERRGVRLPGDLAYRY